MNFTTPTIRKLNQQSTREEESDMIDTFVSVITAVDWRSQKHYSTGVWQSGGQCVFTPGECTNTCNDLTAPTCVKLN